MSTRVITDGSVLKEDTTASGSYTTVPGVYEIAMPDEYDFNTTDVTALDDTIENNIVSIQKSQTCSAKIWWDEGSATQVKLRTKAALKTTSIYKIVTVDGTPKTHTFTAFIEKLGDTTFAPKGAASKTCMLRLTSSIVIT